LLVIAFGFAIAIGCWLAEIILHYYHMKMNGEKSNHSNNGGGNLPSWQQLFATRPIKLQFYGDGR
jgi:hypothetical protein